MSPFGEIGERKEFVHISRRSLCDECTLKNDCIRVHYRSECKDFQPISGFVFNNCRECGKSYEVHTAWKNDFLDECPECNEARKAKRMAT
jgi:hypothetical protein